MEAVQTVTVVDTTPEKTGTYMDRPALQGKSLKGDKGKVAHIYPAFD